MTNLNEITYIDWQYKLNTIGSVAEGVDDINQCIAIILTTRKGSVPLRPTFGSEIYKYVEAAAKGQHTVTSEEWTRLMLTVDIMYPDFSGLLRERVGKMTIPQLHVCYLMRLGLPYSKIENIVELTRVTVWRWSKKCSWIYDGM